MEITVTQIPEVTDIDIAFGTTDHLPYWDDLPEDFRRQWHWRTHPFCGPINELWHAGGKLTDHGLQPKPGVDEEKAMRVIAAHLRSFRPKHEHKIAGVAYMASQWFAPSPPPQESEGG